MEKWWLVFADTGPRNLGARLAPDGNNNDEMAYLILKGRTVSKKYQHLLFHGTKLCYHPGWWCNLLWITLCVGQSSINMGAPQYIGPTSPQYCHEWDSIHTKRVLFFGPTFLRFLWIHRHLHWSGHYATTNVAESHATPRWDSEIDYDFSGESNLNHWDKNATL